MKPNDLIKEIETRYRKWTWCIPKLERLAEKHPDALVALSVGGGDCEYEGVYAPITEDGDYDISKKQFIPEGSPMPSEPLVIVK